jgi:hypothetical protein
VLRGTYNSFEWDSTTAMGTPSAMTQVCKVKNLSAPDQIKKLIALDSTSQFLAYAIQG